MKTQIFTRIVAILCGGLLFGTPLRAQIVVEAEGYSSAVHGSTPMIAENSGMSIGYFDELGESLTYTVSIPASGYYEMKLRYLSGVNGSVQVATYLGAKASIHFGAASAGEWWKTPIGNWSATAFGDSPLYYFASGQQTFSLINAGSAVNIDRIELFQSTVTNTAISSITIEPTTLELQPGKKLQITAYGINADNKIIAAPIAWSSNCPNGLFSAGASVGIAKGSVSIGTLTKTFNIKIALPQKQRDYVVSQFGQLSVSESRAGANDWAVRGENRNKASLAGPSFFWSGSASTWWTKETVDWMVEDWHIQIIRCPVSIAPGYWENTAPFGSYSPVKKGSTWNNNDYYSNPELAKAMMDEMVAAAIENDIYVIIDFHEHHAQMWKQQAIEFFDYFSKKWGAYPNVLYEIFNEPYVNSQVNEGGYADDVCQTIRANDPDNVIIIGSKNYSRDPEYGASFYKHGNIAGTWHGYVENNHQADWIGKTNWNNGTGVVVTEWGRDATGDGGLVQTFKNAGVIHCSWSVNNKQVDGDEKWSTFASGMTKVSHWTDADLSANGKWMRDMSRSYGYVPSPKIDPNAVTLTGDSDKIIYLPTSSVVPAVTAGTGFGTISYTWTQVSGPNAATFSSKTIASPTISGLVVGKYQFAIAASNGIETKEAQMHVTVLPQGYTIPAGSDVVDNVDDNNTTTLWGGSWSVFDDSGDKGASTITAASSLPNNKAIAATYTLNQGNWAYNPYCGVRVSLKKDASAKDLTSCTAITYRYKGAVHDFRAQMATVADHNYHKIAIPASSVWTTVTIDWSALKQDPTWGTMLGAIDKSSIDHFSWQVSAASGTGTIEIDDLTCVGAGSVPELQFIYLSAGWNLISTNIRPADTTIAKLFKGLDVREIKDMNSYWRKDQPSFLNSLQTITPGAGYLVNMKTAGTLIVAGTPLSINNSPLSINAGWQLIGCPYPTATPIVGIFGSRFSQVKDFEGFWLSNGTANSLENIEPGKGYLMR